VQSREPARERNLSDGDRRSGRGVITHVKKYSIEIGLPLGEATAAAGSIDPNMKYDDVDVGQVTGSEAAQGALNIVRLRQTQCDVDSSTSSVR
jgi:hypothetical protein